MPKGKGRKKKARLGDDGKTISSLILLHYLTFLCLCSEGPGGLLNHLPEDDSESVCSSLDGSVISDEGIVLFNLKRKYNPG